MNVVVVNGEQFPDALSVGPFAAKLNAPILLVGRDTVPATVRSHLDALNPTRIIVIGGTGVVSQAVVAVLANYGLVERVAGANRYETAIEVSKAS